MSGFIEGEDRSQATLFPERIDDYIAEDSAVRVIDVFVDELDLSGLGFKTTPEATGRPGYHPALMLKLFIYGYLNRVQSSRRLEQEANKTIHRYWSSACPQCRIKSQCTVGKYRRVSRWEHVEVLEAMEERVNRMSNCMRIRGSTVEHPFGTIKSWLGPTHFQMKTLKHVSAEMSLHVLAYNLKRMLRIVGALPLMEAMRA